MVQPMEIYVDDETKLTLHGLVQHYVMLNEEEKNRKLNDLLDALDFNQVWQVLPLLPSEEGVQISPLKPAAQQVSSTLSSSKS